MRIVAFSVGLLAFAPSLAAAQDGLGLSAPDAVVQSGLLDHILPRFSLKTGLRVTADPEGALVIAPDPPGTPVLARGGTVWYLRAPDTPDAARFGDWITSEIGRRTIEAFVPDDTAPFTVPVATAALDAGPLFTGDVGLGADLSLSLCGRCHVIGPENRKNGIGSTPSFAVLRTLPDWGDRFQQFYVLRPHGAFTRIADVTTPFDPMRPPPIAPVDMTLDDLDAILAYVAVIEAADLGAPLQRQ